MKTATIVLYVIQALAIICAIITGKEFIDFSSGPALFETIGFFFPAILGLIFDMVAHNKEQKAEQSSTEGSKADSAAPSASSAPKAKAAAPASTKTASAPQEARRLQRRKKPQRRTRKPLRPQQRSNLLSIRPFSTALSAEQGKTPKTLSASLADRRSDNRSSRADSYSHPDKHASSRKMR